MSQLNMIRSQPHDEARLIGSNIRSFRQKAGLSQKNLADRFGCEPNYISQLETGQKTAGLKTRQKLALIFNCSPQDFLQSHLNDQAEDYLTLGPRLTIGLAVRTIKTVMDYLQEHPRKLTPQQYADLFQKILEHCVADQVEPDARLVKAYQRLI